MVIHSIRRGIYCSFQPLYAYSRGRVRSYEVLSLEFISRSDASRTDACQSCLLPVFPSYSTFEIMKIAVSLFEDSDIDSCSDRELSDLAYTILCFTMKIPTGCKYLLTTLLIVLHFRGAFCTVRVQNTASRLK